MARQTGPTKIEGTLANITFYKMGGEFFLLRKTSIDKKRIKSDPAFTQFRKDSKLHGKASSLTSRLYSTLPAEQKVHGYFGKLTAWVKGMLKVGMSEEEAWEV